MSFDIITEDHTYCFVHLSLHSFVCLFLHSFLFFPSSLLSTFVVINDSDLIKDIPIKSIPIVIGGKYKSSNTLIKFNTKKDGPFCSLDIEKESELANEIDMTYVLPEIDKNDEINHNIIVNKINLESSDLTDEDSVENMNDKIDFEKDSDRIIIAENCVKKNPKMTVEEKEIQILRGYNNDILKYNELLVQNNIISGLNFPKKESVNFRDKLLRNGTECSFLLKIAEIGRTKVNFLESRIRNLEETKKKECEDEERGKREMERERERVRETEIRHQISELDTVKKTRKGNSRCSDVSVMSPEKSCKVNCSVQ